MVVTGKIITIDAKDTTELCNAIERAIGNSVVESGKVSVRQLLNEIFVSSVELAKNRMQSTEKAECKLGYRECSNEYLVWALGLLSMAWTTEILRRKGRDGNCHTHKEAEKKPCQIGREVHTEMHQDCIESFETLLTLLKNKKIDDPD